MKKLFSAALVRSFSLSLLSSQLLILSIAGHHVHHPSPGQVLPSRGDVALERGVGLRNVPERSDAEQQREQRVEAEAE